MRRDRAVWWSERTVNVRKSCYLNTLNFPIFMALTYSIIEAKEAPTPIVLPSSCSHNCIDSAVITMSPYHPIPTRSPTLPLRLFSHVNQKSYLDYIIHDNNLHLRFMRKIRQLAAISTTHCTIEIAPLIATSTYSWSTCYLNSWACCNFCETISNTTSTEELHTL